MRLNCRCLMRGLPIWRPSLTDSNPIDRPSMSRVPSSGSGRAHAVFIFNHRFERNLDKLDTLYADRFPERTHLMPFARSDRSDVYCVHETSWQFSGHVAQGAAAYIDDAATHYVFISDDLILNPSLNADNIVRELGLDADTGYIKSLAPLDAQRYRWHRALPATIALRRNGGGFDWRVELPPEDEARAKFRDMGLVDSLPRLHSAGEAIDALRKLLPAAGYLTAPWAVKLYGRPSDYPLLMGYADFFVVPAAAIRRFAHLCGVFAALDIFAEVAVPTALALACDRVVTELVPGERFVDPEAQRLLDRPWQGVEFWDPAQTPAFAKRFGNQLSRLIDDFPPDMLYVHPVKLSQWR